MSLQKQERALKILQAEAWEDGYYAARRDWISGNDEATPNPFIEGGDD